MLSTINLKMLFLTSFLASLALANNLLTTSLPAPNTLAKGPCKDQTVVDSQNGHALLPCWCYNNGDGVNRDELVTAITNFCNAATTTVWGDQALNVDKLVYLPYWPDPDRPILVKQEWWAMHVNDDTICQPHFTISADDCITSMEVIIDGCNKKTTTDKQGGFGYDACLLWTVDPNPSINNPYILSAMMSSMSATALITGSQAAATGR